MKKQFFIILVMLSLEGVSLAYSFSARCSTGQILYYNFSGTRSVQVTYPGFYGSDSYSGYPQPSGVLQIPSSVTYNGYTYSVTSIESYAFYACSGLTSITIPNSVTSIGSYAFYACSGLTSVTIPNSVTSIGNYAFQNCSGLTSIDVENGNTVYDSRIGCNAIIETATNTLITGCKNTIIPNSVTSIGNCAFDNCTGLTSVTIPNSVTSIGYAAFRECSGLTGTLTIPNSVTSIGNYAFSACSGLTGTLTIGNSVTSIGSYAFYACSGLTGTLTIPNSVTSIGSYAFDACSGLTGTLTIGNSVTSIGICAFNACSGLTGTLTIPNSVTSIGSYAFYACSGLTGTLTIGNSVTSIGRYAFYACSGLTTLNFNADRCGGDGFSYNYYDNHNYLQYVHCSWLSGCSSLTTVNIGNNVRVIPANAFRNCTSLTSVTIGNSVTSIGEYAFGFCSGLTTLNFNADSCGGEGLVANFHWLSGCSALTAVNIGNNVRVIPDRAFAGCSGLTSVTIPNSVTSIESHAFIGCYGLTSVTIGNSVTSIGDAAFCNCSGLTSVTIPNSVTSIGNNTFERCRSLNRVRMLSSHPPTLSFRHISEDPFYLVPSGLNIEVPCFARWNYMNSSWGNLNCNIIETIGFWLVTSSMDETMGSAMVTTTPTCHSATAVITATANEGYRFDHWDNGCTGNPYTLTLTSDTALVAFFVPLNQYTVSVQPNNSSMGIVTGGGTYWEQSTATLTAIPLAGYVFLQWQDGNTDNPRTVVVSSDSSFTAQFIASITLTANVNNSDMGSVTGSGTYIQGDTVIMTATANEGYLFTQWNDGNTDNPRTVVVTCDTMFTAQFVALVTLVTHVNNTSMGSVTGGGRYEPGTSVTLTATANEGYHFTQWNDGNTDNPRTVVVNTDTSFTAQFAANEYIVTLAVNDTAMGSTTGAGTYEYATQATIKALPAEGYHFDHWNDGITSALRRVTIVCDTSFTAFFSANQYTLTVESNNDAMGSVTGGGSYDYNSSVTLAATANTGYQFDHWNDGNTDNPRTVTVTGDATYIANFSSTQGIEDAEADGVEVVVRNGRITVSGAEGRSMVLTDALGRVLYRSTATETLTLDAPATGVYLLQVEGLPAQRVAVVK